MANVYQKRRLISIIASLILLCFVVWSNTPMAEYGSEAEVKSAVTDASDRKFAINGLKELKIKGRAPKTDYSRDKFGSGWASDGGCDTRNIILNRDLNNVVLNDKCEVVSGVLNDPYTGTVINFKRGESTSGDVQIDHVVALSDAWQKGAQLLTQQQRVNLANDPLELLAVDGPANQEKSDGDAATWLPSNKSFRCQYVARQIAIKLKYNLWVTVAEYDAMDRVLSRCEDQLLPKT